MTDPRVIAACHCRPAIRKTIEVSRKKGGLELTGWEFTSEGFSAETEEIDPGKTFKVHVTFTPSQDTALPRSVVDMLYLHTNDPEEPTVSVRLLARIR